MPNIGRPSSGCHLCRKRRIKCDEGKPQCRNCIKARRQCPGYRTEEEAWAKFSPESRRTSAAVPVLPTPPTSDGSESPQNYTENPSFIELDLNENDPPEQVRGDPTCIELKLEDDDEPVPKSTSGSHVFQLPAANYHSNVPIRIPEFNSGVPPEDKPESEPSSALIAVKTHELNQHDLSQLGLAKSLTPISDYDYDYYRLYAFTMTPAIFAVKAKQRAYNEVMISGSLTEPALHHAVMASSAFTLSTMKGSADISEYESHKHASIQHINKSLARKDQPVSAAVIYAIMHILGFETAFGEGGSKTNAIIHLEGVRSIIQLRGGFQNLHFTGVNQVLLEDVSVAVTSDRRPVFQKFISSLPLPVTHSPLIQPRTDSILCSMGKGFSEKAYLFDTWFLEILNDLRDAAIFAENTSSDDEPAILDEVERYDTLRLYVMYRLADMDHYSETTTVQQQLCRDVLLMYTIQREFGMFNQSDVMKKLGRRVRAALYSTDRNDRYAEAPAFMLWALFQAAGHTESEPSMKEWFLMELASTGKKLCLSTWEDVEPLLATFIYIPSYQGQNFQKLWSQVCESYP